MALNPNNFDWLQKLRQINVFVLILIGIMGAISAIMLYSAAGGDVSPWAQKQLLRFAMGVTIMLLVALTPLHFWLRQAYVLYGVSVVLLVIVEIAGTIGMGAQRWIDLYVFRLQPSELVKLTLVLSLARYYHYASLESARKFIFHLPPLLITIIPAVLVLKQPDLGTALLLFMITGVMIFVSGIRLWKVGLILTSAIACMPLAWMFLRDYQKNRVLTFLNPERDPLGSGYHILQSKIAFGSGGVWGKGLLQGSQSQLKFLPEKHTDFIFAMLSEELGMVGGIILIGFYSLLIFYGYMVSLHCRNIFGKLLAFGLTTILFLYMFINMAMVMGLLPIVGMPLPLISYGGTSMLTLLTGFGLILCVDRHRHLRRGLSAP
ncbi:MAG: rod shape-determining protein RodA [Pseudomonadota bacterium]